METERETPTHPHCMRAPCATSGAACVYLDVVMVMIMITITMMIMMIMVMIIAMTMRLLAATAWQPATRADVGAPGIRCEEASHMKRWTSAVVLVMAELLFVLIFLLLALLALLVPVATNTDLDCAKFGCVPPTPARPPSQSSSATGCADARPAASIGPRRPHQVGCARVPVEKLKCCTWLTHAHTYTRSPGPVPL